MTREDWDRVFEIFHGSRERSGDGRQAYLLQECGADHSLMAAVEQLLQTDEEAAGFLSQPFTGLRRSIGPAISEGQVFGRYTATSYLGHGGMGEVWRGHDRDLDRPVALKFLANGFGVDQLTREARHASALNHPGIVTVHEVLVHGQTPVLVMELVEGTPLSRIPSGPPEAHNLIPLLVQISEALAAAHAKGIIHGDLKPDNILVRQDGFIKILDFGLARRVTTENIAAGGLLAGTLIYMSPEQARGERLTPATDVFSLGLLIFELITGRNAFGRSGVEAVQSMLYQSAPRPSTIVPSLTKEWDTLLESMLQPEATRRCLMSDVAVRLRAMQSPHSPVRWRWLAVALFLLAAVAVAMAINSRFNEPRGTAEPQWVARPLTSDNGDEFGPSFSPDGTRVVYAWRPEDEGFLSIFEQSLAGGSRRRLVTGSTSSYGPAWSPDGRLIAYVQVEGDGGAIFVIPASGGPPRRIVQLQSLPYHARRALDWFVDSEWIAYSDKDPASGRECLFATSVRTGESRKLAEPDSVENFGEPTFSPDGSMLAFTHGSDGVSQLGLLRVTGNLAPQGRPWSLKIEGFETATSNDLMWRPNGKELLFLSTKGGAVGHLWTVDVFGSESEARTARMVGSLGEGVFTPATSKVGNYLIFSRRLQDKNIWRVDLSRKNQSQQTRLGSSTQQEYFPQYSPDAQRIAFESDRSGFPEIWISDADGRSAFAVTDYRGPVTGSPAWSPDGSQIAFDTRASGKPQIYVVAAATGNTPRRLTFGEGDNVLPVWSPDRKFIYFNSNRKGDFQVWRVPSAGGAEEQVTSSFGFAPQLSPDGNFLYYMTGRSVHSAIQRLELKSGIVRMVVPKARDRSFFAAPGGVFYIDRLAANLEALRFWNAATNVDSAVARAEGRHAGGLSVSRDGRSALIVKDDSVGADLMLVRDFR